MDFCANEVGADDNMLHFAVINGVDPEIRNHITRTQPTTWSDLVYHAKVGEMCVPVSPPSNPTLAVKLEAIQDQLEQLRKVHTVSPVCFAGCSDSCRESSRSDSRSGSLKRVHFESSADQGVQDYRYTQDDLRDDRRTRSEERQSFNNWNNEGRSQQWNAGPQNREFSNRNRFSASQGREFLQQQGPSTCMYVYIVKGQGFISPVETGCQRAHTTSQGDSQYVVAEFYIEML